MEKRTSYSLLQVFINRIEIIIEMRSKVYHVITTPINAFSTKPNQLFNRDRRLHDTLSQFIASFFNSKGLRSDITRHWS